MFWLEHNFSFRYFVSKDTIINTDHFPQELVSSCCLSLTWSHNLLFVAIISSAETNCDVTGRRLWLQGQKNQQKQVTSKTWGISSQYKDRLNEKWEWRETCLSLLRRKYSVNSKWISLLLYQGERIYPVSVALLKLVSSFSFD